MIFDIITLFPDLFAPVLQLGMTGRALQKGLMAYHLTNPRQFAIDARGSVDDIPYGGGSGMVLRPEPLVGSLEHIASQRGRGHRILLTPAGTPVNQKTVRRWSGLPHLILVCGRYEGMDERVCKYVDEEVSIGDFILSGGELAALALVDAVTRLLPGVLHDAHSTVEESFENDLLEYPQYTRPPAFREDPVPAVLLSGNHAEIKRWRQEQSLLRTKARRPDLLR